MKLSQGLALSQKQVLSQRLEQKQLYKLVLAQGISLRLDLIQVLTGDNYRPEGVCPKCRRPLSPVEIIQGFNRDPQDFTTACPVCKTRFQPQLICIGHGYRMELPFYCSIQLLDQLRGKEIFSPQRLSQQHAAIYRSAIVHYGSIVTAFKKLGIDYPFDEFINWENKITPFLGHMRDIVIANCANVSVARIRALRKKLGIPRFTVKNLTEQLIND